MIELDNLTKIYTTGSPFFFRRQKQSRLAINNISLSIDEGQIFGLLGVNGAGKTTTVKILSTLLEPTSGRAIVGGDDVVRNANKVRKKVNMIAGGERMLYWRLTARENLAYFADLYNVEERIKRKRIEELLDLVGLTEDADRRVEEYSKGMKQRLQIARGLINDPKYLFMDEPTIGLDAPIAREIRWVIKQLNKTIVFTTHYMPEAEELCDEIAIIHKGEIVEQGTPEQLKQKHKQSHFVILTIAGNGNGINEKFTQFCHNNNATFFAKEEDESYQIRVETSHDVTSELVDIVTATERRILELRSIEPTLEDVIITITTEETKK